MCFALPLQTQLKFDPFDFAFFKLGLLPHILELGALNHIVVPGFVSVVLIQLITMRERKRELIEQNNEPKTSTQETLYSKCQE